MSLIKDPCGSPHLLYTGRVGSGFLSCRLPSKELAKRNVPKHLLNIYSLKGSVHKRFNTDSFIHLLLKLYPLASPLFPPLATSGPHESRPNARKRCITRHDEFILTWGGVVQRKTEYLDIRHLSLCLLLKETTWPCGGVEYVNTRLHQWVFGDGSPIDGRCLLHCVPKCDQWVIGLRGPATGALVRCDEPLHDALHVERMAASQPFRGGSVHARDWFETDTAWTLVVTDAEPVKEDFSTACRTHGSYSFQMCLTSLM
jgi:hypothetical protein